MDRRDAIKHTALLLGGVLSAEAVRGVLDGCMAEPVAARTPGFFTADEGRLVAVMVDRIIPRTDTPGAVDAGVPAFIDAMMQDFYAETDRIAFREGLARVNADARSAHGDVFVLLAPEQQDGLIERYDRDAFGPPSPGAGRNYFRTLKELTMLGFFTSQVGATRFLKYDPSPGSYRGCIPYSEVGAGWATR